MHNPAFAELYGLDEETSAEGLPLDSIGDGAWADAVVRQRLTDVLLRGRELWDYEHEQRTADDVVRIMLINARRMPLPDKDDEVVLMTVSDVTVQRAVQLRVEELNRQLEGKVEQVSEVNRELEAFSYSVSHDLRAPLRHVAGFSDKLTRHLGDEADEKSLHYLGVISNSARRMAALIDDLLVYSRLGRAAMRLQAVDMQSLVADTRAMLDANQQSEAESSGVPHHVDWKIAPLPIIVSDENMMRQVWLNLLGNAIKYSSNREPARIEVDYKLQPDGSHLFTVRDNGAGFDMAYAGKLFGVFQRLHKASDYPGTGIGLASVRRVLTAPPRRSHLGRIGGRSRRHVPLRSSTRARRNQQGLRRMTALRTILLAEDSPADAEMAIDALKEARLANPIVHVEDGVEAMDYLLRRGAFANRDEGLPAVLLLDIKMPRMDGLEVLKEIRNTEELKRLPVVILSSSREESDLARSWDMGVNAYVVKPVDVDQFFGAVQTLGKFWGLINQAPEIE